MQKHSIARSVSGARWNPRDGLIGSDQGLWLDPSDLTTLFQDAAGTTPVTAVEQPVGLMLDKSGRGNHAFQTVSTKRPVLSARVNLLTKTEDISTADWIKLGTSAPNADTLLELAVSGVHRVSQSKNVPATKCCLYAEFYPAGRSSCSLSLYDVSGGTTRAGAVFSIDGAGSIISGSTALNKISLLPDGWYGCYIESTSAFSGGNTDAYIGATNGAAQSYTGDATKGVRVRKVDLRPVNTGVNLPAYQRVNTATDYDTQGFPVYLKFDKIDDAMQTNSIDFSYGDKMFVSAGVRKLSDAAIGILVELGQITTQTGGFSIANGYLGPNVWNFDSKGTVGVDVRPSRTAPITDVLTLQSSITSPTILSTRINGAASGSNTNSQGSGSFNNLPIYIGARAGTSLFFNGYLYQLVICGRPTTVPIDQITRTEEFVNRKTKAY